jgi:hypothetical protein
MTFLGEYGGKPYFINPWRGVFSAMVWWGNARASLKIDSPETLKDIVDGTSSPPEGINTL